MCGGFAVLLGVSRTSVVDNLRAQLLYSSGRLITYGSFGAMAGFGGKSLTDRMAAYLNVPAVLSFVAGAFLIWEGLHAAGWRWGRKVAGRSPCLLSPLLASLLRHPALRHAFFAGLFTGFLPCGLVYAFVSLAASQADLLHGAGTMLAFGAGTIPLMVLTGVGAMWLSLPWRQRLWQVAAWSVVVTGGLTLGRGYTFLTATEADPAARCPFCAAADSAANPLGNELVR
jgi:hypothetical protein